jgi:hypothetical protein
MLLEIGTINKQNIFMLMKDMHFWLSKMHDIVGVGIRKQHIQ